MNSKIKSRVLILFPISAVFVMSFACSSCANDLVDAVEKDVLEAGPQTKYSVLYDGNGNDTGTVPTDSTLYIEGESVTAGDSGDMGLSGSSFTGWNTESDGSGNHYGAGSKFPMPAMDLILYAEWTSNPTYAVTYNGNGSDGGTLPVDTNNYEENDWVTVKEAGVTRTGHTFTQWTTNSNGTGDAYAPYTNFQMGSSDISLYAQWSINSYTVTYDGNSEDGGVHPSGTPSDHEYNSTVTVLDNTGDYFKNGYKFIGWNTQSDGNGTFYSAGNTFTMGASSITLYAQWGVYSIGDTGPAGGVIFYDKGSFTNGWRYLELYTSDLSTGTTWSNTDTTTHADAASIGSGLENTNTIVSVIGSNGYAAYMCDALVAGGASDWFLPTRYTLVQMYNNLPSYRVSAEYWTSTEWTTDQPTQPYVYGFDMGTGSQISNRKKTEHSLRVRAVRRF